MENHFLDILLEELAEVISSQSFELQEDGSYLNADKRFKIEFEENTMLYRLLLSQADDEPQYVTVSSWKFNEEKGEKEARTIGKDFADTLYTKLGLNKNRRQLASGVPLPSKKSGSKSQDVGGVCQQMLAIFPKYKDTYRDHVAANGEFLYINFFTETFVPEIRAILDGGNKKQCKKVFDALSNLYVEGDRMAQNCVAVVLTLGAIGDSDKRYENACIYLEGCPYLKSILEQLYKKYKRNNKKLKAIVK